jgi:hypothetical protein
MFFVRRFFLKDDLIFPDCKLFFKYFIDFVPSEDNPWSYDKEKKPDEKPEESRIKCDGKSDNHKHDSKEEHFLEIKNEIRTIERNRHEE